MKFRFQELTDRGYSREEVLKTCSYNEDDLFKASKIIFAKLSKDCFSSNNPKAVFIGGQPGCGKSFKANEIKNKDINNVLINIDDYRIYHPNYNEIEKLIIKHWINKEETENDSPGNDLADMTTDFAGEISDAIMQYAIDNNYNLIVEWGMRSPEEPLKALKKLKDNHYQNSILFIATNPIDSYKNCTDRNKIVIYGNHIIRNIPKRFHDECVKSLPNSINKIWIDGKDLFYEFNIIKIDGTIIWDKTSLNLPGDIFEDFVNQHFD